MAWGLPIVAVTGEVIAATWGNAVRNSLDDIGGNDHVFTVSQTVNDDVMWKFGSDSDWVVLNRSTTLAANTTLANVIVGTPVTPAIAADSLIIGGITASGDVLGTIQRGGNSEAYLFVDASAGDVYLYARGVQQLKLVGGGAPIMPTGVAIGTLTLADGSIIDSGGSISFGNENLDTTGWLAVGSATIDPGQKLYVTDGTAGAVTPSATNSQFTIESDDNAGMSMLSPATKSAIIYFGSPTSATRAWIQYNHSSDQFLIGTAGADRFHFTNGTIVLKQSTTISNSSGDLTIGGAHKTTLTSGDTVGASDGAIVVGGLPTSTASAIGSHLLISASVNEPASGAAAQWNQVGIIGGAVIGAGGSITLATKLYIDVAFSGPTTSYSILVDSGDVVLDDGVIIGATRSDDAKIDDSTHGSGSTTLYIGNATINTTSDLRVKSNIVAWDGNPMGLLRQAELIEFDYELEGGGGPWGPNARSRYIGMAAQETIKWAPWVVNAGSGVDCPACNSGSVCVMDHAMWTVEYEHLVPLVIAGLQQVDRRIETQEEKIQRLEERVRVLERPQED